MTTQETSICLFCFSDIGKTVSGLCLECGRAKYENMQEETDEHENYEDCYVPSRDSL